LKYIQDLQNGLFIIKNKNKYQLGQWNKAGKTYGLYPIMFSCISSLYNFYKEELRGN
jgi:hypothetical protein